MSIPPPPPGQPSPFSNPAPFGGPPPPPGETSRPPAPFSPQPPPAPPAYAPGPYQQQPQHQPYQQPFPGAPTGPYGFQPATSTKRLVNRAVAIAAVACAAIAAVGSVLPWASVNFGFGEFTVDGLDADGKLTIVLAIAAGAMLIVSIANGATWPVIVGIPLFALNAVIAVIDIADVASTFDDSSGFFDDSGVEATVGIGLYLVLIGALAGAVACIVGLATRKSRA